MTISKSDIRKLIWLLAAIMLILVDLIFIRTKDFYEILWMNYFILHIIFIGLALGIISLISIHLLIGAKWSVSFLNFAHLPPSLFTILMFSFLPLFIAFIFLSPFRDFEHIWFHPVGIAIRTVILFLIWHYISKQLGESLKVSAINLMIILLTLIFLSSDWLLPLMLNSKIAVMPFFLFTSFLQLALAFMVLYSKEKTTDFFDKMGRYILALSLFWFYFLFSFILIDWYALLPQGITFINLLLSNSRFLLLLLVILCNSLLPLLLLLQSGFRLKERNIKVISWMIIIGKFAEFLVISSPSITDGKFIAGLSEIAFLIIYVLIMLELLKKKKKD